jgi:regulatory protein
MEADPNKRLMQKAGKLLAVRARSRGELRLKLSSLAEEAQLEEFLDRLQELDLLNDAEYAYNFAVRRFRQDGWGPAKVFHSLLRHHVAPPAAESAIERVRQQTGDELLLQEYLERYFRKSEIPRDRKGIQKLVCHLRRRGFHEDIIFQILRRRIPAAAWGHIDTGE